MTNKLSFQIEKKGFPINIGEVEFFFGTTPEELTRFFDTQAEFEEQVKELKQQLKQIKNIEQPEKEDAIKIIDLTKSLAKAEYDSLLGKGSFEKIYSAIEKEALKRKDTLSKKKADLLKKKALKNKKKK